MEQNENLAREIAQLEAQLAAKKQEAIASPETHEREVLKEVITEQAGTAETPGMSIPATPAPTPAPSDDTNREVTAEEEQQLASLVEHSLTNGIASAVSKAKKTNDPFFIDMLHDRLADQYYEKLIQARKLKEL